MTQGVEMLPVEQSDRDMAAGWIAGSPYDVVKAEAEMIRIGQLDNHRLVQAFARHRLNTHPAATGSVREFAWPEPRWIAVGQGQAMNPDRVKAAFELINGELVIGEQFQLIERLLNGTEFTVVDAAAPTPNAAANIPADVRDDIVCVRDAVTDEQWERLWVSLHGLKCNPVMDEITLVMQEVVAILCRPTPDAAASDAAVPAGPTQRQVIDAIYSALPSSRWSCSDDESGTTLTLARQRKWCVDAVKALYDAAPKAASDTDAAASEAGEGWQDIETADRDCMTNIDMWCASAEADGEGWNLRGILMIGTPDWIRREDASDYFPHENGGFLTHWRPLPTPPATALTTQGGAEG